MGNTPLWPRCRKRMGDQATRCGAELHPEDLTGRKGEPVTRSTLYRRRTVRPVEYRCPRCKRLGWSTHPQLAGK